MTVYRGLLYPPLDVIDWSVIVAFPGYINWFAFFISGVTVHRSSGDLNIYAKSIISSAGVKNTFKQLLPREIAANFRESF